MDHHDLFSQLQNKLSTWETKSRLQYGQRAVNLHVIMTIISFVWYHICIAVSYIQGNIPVHKVQIQIQTK